MVVIAEPVQLKASIYAHLELGNNTEGLEWSRICRAYEAGFSEGFSEGLKSRTK